MAMYKVFLRFISASKGVLGSREHFSNIYADHFLVAGTQNLKSMGFFLRSPFFRDDI